MASIINTIIGAHIRRVGAIRAISGAALLYLVSPITFLVHIFLLPFHYLFNWTHSDIAPKLRDYVIIDRHKIKDLHWIDKIGCVYCALVNGSTYYTHELLKYRLHQKHSKTTTWGIIKESIYLFYFIPISLKNFLARILILEPFLRLYNVYKPLSNTLENPSHLLTAHAKFRHRLAETETVACPIKHLEKPGQHIPEHHKNFIDRKDVASIWS